MSEELRKSFHGDLDSITETVLQMIAIVTESIGKGTEVLLNNDLKGAQEMIDDDDILDALSVQLEEQCYQLLALQAPMASDLRMIVAALSVNADIERSGDLVSNIVKATRRLYGNEYHPKLRGLVMKMSTEAQRMFRLAGEAYATRDVGLAAALDDIDDRLDDLNVENVQTVFEAHGNEEIDLQAAVQLALIGRFYERIGDHAVNVGERIQYMVTGWMPEHTGAARATARQRAAGSSVTAQAAAPEPAAPVEEEE